MRTARPVTPFASRVASPSIVPDLVAPKKLDRAEAVAAISREVKESVFRPSDIAQARIDEAAFFYAPFWRVDVSVDGFHLGLTTLRSGPDTVLPFPTGGARSSSAAIMIPARSTLPYTPKLPSKLLGTLSPVPPLDIELHELVTVAGLSTPLPVGDCIDADVTRELAERIAAGLLRQSVQPRSALYAKYETLIRDATCVYYPLYFATYRYVGEASAANDEEFFVMISGRTGKPASVKHPSAARAVAAKFRKLLSFDW